MKKRSNAVRKHGTVFPWGMITIVNSKPNINLGESAFKSYSLISS